MENEVFEAFCFLLYFLVVKGRKVRSRIVILEACFTMSQFFGVDQFECLSLNIVKYSILCFVFFILIFDAKDPHVSEANDVSQKVRILLFYTHICGLLPKGRFIWWIEADCSSLLALIMKYLKNGSSLILLSEHFL